MYLQIKIFQFQLYLQYLQSHFHQFRHCQWMWFLCQPSYLSNLKVQGLGAALPFQIHWQSCSSITTKTKEKEMTMMTHCTKTWMKQWFHSRRDHREWEWNCRFHPREPNRASLLPLPTKTACSWVYTQLTWEPKPRPKPTSKTFPHLTQVSVISCAKQMRPSASQSQTFTSAGQERCWNHLLRLWCAIMEGHPILTSQSWQRYFT